MPLILAEKNLLLTRLFHLSTSGATLDRFLADLCVDALGIFEARSALIFGLEKDFSIPLLSQFGLNSFEEAPYQGQHFEEDSPLTRCLKTGLLVANAGDSGWPGIDKDHYVVFVPIQWRQSAVAALVIVMVRDPEVSAQESLWATFGSGVALTLVSKWQPAEKATYDTPAEHPHFSERQILILRLVATGMSNRQVAKQLHLGLSTVGHELMAIFSGLEVNTREEAVRRASLLGLLTPSEAPPSGSLVG
jgi:DNA-binding CsgD family transcriptional regulator